VAILAIGLTRFGISYLIILMLIGFFMPIIAGNKKGAIFTGVLYATLSYILSYPSGLYLINYMPKEAIPVSVSSSSVFFNLFMGWLIPVVISTVVCGIFSIAGYAVKNIIYGKEDTTEHYFESTEEMEQIKTDDEETDTGIASLGI
jgi:hypothetical protein